MRHNRVHADGQIVAVPPFFRVFISSPFADLRAERFRLERAVFRPLAADCARRGGCLQIIDLRWGISFEAGLVQRTMTLCLQEIERCRAVSPRLNFLLFMGNRRGWLPPPVTVDSADLDAVRSELASAERDLLDA